MIYIFSMGILAGYLLRYLGDRVTNKKTPKHTLVIGSEWVLEPSDSEMQNPYEKLLPKNHCKIIDISGDYVQFQYVNTSHKDSDRINKFLNIYIPFDDFHKRKQA